MSKMRTRKMEWSDPMLITFTHETVETVKGFCQGGNNVTGSYWCEGGTGDQTCMDFGTDATSVCDTGSAGVR